MKVMILLGLIALMGLASAGILPASTTLLKSTPIAYSQPILPTVYSQPILAHYATSFIPQGPIFAQQQILAQYPGLLQYPVAQNPVFGESPVQVGPVIEAADSVGSPVLPPSSVSPVQQSPILDGRPGSSTVDDDTISVEAV